MTSGDFTVVRWTRRSGLFANPTMRVAANFLLLLLSDGTCPDRRKRARTTILSRVPVPLFPAMFFRESVDTRDGTGEGCWRHGGKKVLEIP